MTKQCNEIYDAFIAANVPADIARAAAVAVVNGNGIYTLIEERLTKLETRVAILEWICGTNLVFTTGIILKLLFFT